MHKKRTHKRLFTHISMPFAHKFTPEEEMEIELYCRETERWMKEKYGKGAQPHRLGVGNI